MVPPFQGGTVSDVDFNHPPGNQNQKLKLKQGQAILWCLSQLFAKVFRMQHAKASLGLKDRPVCIVGFFILRLGLLEGASLIF